MAKTCIIANPNAGGAERLEELREQVAGRPGFELHLTRAPGHGPELADQAVRDGFETVIAAGGDGTLNEVVNGLADHFGKVRFGILPFGTGNDFGRTLEMPNELEQAMAVIDAEHTRPCDVARIVNGGSHYFINVSAGGFSGEINEKLTSELKQAWGPLAYLRAAIESISELSPYDLKMVLEDEEGARKTIEMKALNVVVANARHVAAGVPIAPAAEIGDGLLDVVVIKDCSLAALALLAPRVMASQHLEDSCDEIAFWRARTIEIEATPEMAFNADGELLDDPPHRYEIIPGALDVIVPDLREDVEAAEEIAERAIDAARAVVAA